MFGLMLIIQGLIENTKTSRRIKKWILNFRTPHWLQQYFRTCSCSCSQSHSSSPSPPSPLPGIGGSVKEVREWWECSPPDVRKRLSKIEEFIEKTQITSPTSVSPTTTSGKPGSSLDAARCKWLEAELGNKVKIVKFGKKCCEGCSGEKKI